MENKNFDQQNKYKKNVLKIVFSGIAIFSFGIFVGYQLNHGTISSIQGYLFNALSEATDANATNSNATNANGIDYAATNSNATDTNVIDYNATNANATDANWIDYAATNSNATDTNVIDYNATNANATDANASSKDNIIYLNSLSLNSDNIDAGEKVIVNKVTTGAPNVAMTIMLLNNSTKTAFTVSVKSIVKDPHIIIPKNATPGTYSIRAVFLVGKNTNGTTFSKTYTPSNYDFNTLLTINSTTDEILNLNNISLKSNSADIGDKVYFTYDSSAKVESMKFEFVGSNGNKMVVYGKSLNDNPYFEIPSTSTSDVYSLSVLTLSSSFNTSIYSKDGSVSNSKKYNFNSTIEIKDNNLDNHIYNNEDIDSKIISTLYNTDLDTKITINADSNPIITGELFNAIKGTPKELLINYNDNQLVFAGNDIKTSKDIDVSVTSSDVADDDEIKQLVNDGIIIDFASNGDLPGTANVKIKITDEMSKKLGNNPIYIYYYNEMCEDFSIIAENIIAKNGYYEFKLSHNSRYLLSSVKLDDSLIANSQDKIVKFQKSNTMNLLLIGLGALLIIVVIAIITVKKVKDKKLKINSNDNNRTNTTTEVDNNNTNSTNDYKN